MQHSPKVTSSHHLPLHAPRLSHWTFRYTSYISRSVRLTEMRYTSSRLHGAIFSKEDFSQSPAWES